MGQIEVLVKHKETGEDRITTYHAYLDTQYAFELIGQVDSKGNLVPGDPNLNPRHQKQPAKDAVPAGNSGLTMEEKEQMKADLIKKYSRPNVVQTDEVKTIVVPENAEKHPDSSAIDVPIERKKPGRPKTVAV